MAEPKPKVMIVGGGFGGLAADERSARLILDSRDTARVDPSGRIPETDSRRRAQERVSGSASELG